MNNKTNEPDIDDELVQIVVSSFPKKLLKVIDRDAKRNNRSRSAEIRTLLANRVAERLVAQAA